MTAGLHKFALIGFGEAGSILGEDLAAAGRDVVMYDILLDAPASREAMLARARRAHVRAAGTFEEAVAGVQVVICAVTASSSADVAGKAAKSLRAGQVLLDINSVSPAKKLSNAALVEAAGADYVEAAVMAPVPPQRLQVPMLLGGKRAGALAVELRNVGMNTTALSEQIGVASAVKMCRSIVIKGLEALTVESMLAARQFGAEREVLESLNGTFPSMGWTGPLPDYLVSRAAEHGRRRAAEMREVARTLQDVDVEPTMALATAARQDWLIDAMAAKGLTYSSLSSPFSWRDLVDCLTRDT
ncbi:MAG: NAD(P)-dependent oxidoreductase [Gammaproteobacteria bacterium]|nr:NAD(P)-dependent oxidoreductase [Gammaproteobacteria bacterium]